MKKQMYIISVILVFIDQIIKVFISNSITLNTNIEIIPKFFYISNVHNDGAAFSIFSGNQLFLILFTLIALLFIYMFFIKDKDLSKIEAILLMILLGGILGNFIDRIIYNYVIDYLEFIIFNYQFPIFNFADICITLSVIGLLILSFKEDICKKKELVKTKAE